MPIEFRCTQCGKLLRVADAGAGKKARCPECGHVLDVPGSAAPAADPPAGRQASSVETGGNPFAVTPHPALAEGFNPYASPAALDRRSAYGGPEAGRPPLPPGELDMGALLSASWEIYKFQWPMCILATLIASGMAVAFLLVEAAAGVGIAVALAEGPANREAAAILTAGGIILGIVVLMLFMTWVQAGMTRFLLHLARRGEVQLGELVRGGRNMLPMLCAGLLSTLVVALGMAACIVPGVLLFLMFSQAAYLIVDREVGPIEALRLSRQLTAGKKFNLFVVYLVVMGLSFAAGLVPCGIGSIFVAPYIALLLAMTYLVLAGQPAAPAGMGH